MERPAGCGRKDAGMDPITLVARAGVLGASGSGPRRLGVDRRFTVDNIAAGHPTR